MRYLLILLVLFSCSKDVDITPVESGFAEKPFVCDFASEADYKSYSATKEVEANAYVQPVLAVGGVNQTVTIQGSGFGNEKGRLRFGYGGTAINYNILEWTDTKIVSYVPSNAYSGPIDIKSYDNSVSYGVTNDLTVKYNINIGMWSYDTWNRAVQVYGEIVWRPVIGTSGDLVVRFQQALDEWKCATGINWSIGEPIDHNLNPPAGSVQEGFAFGYGYSAGAAHEQTFYKYCEDGSIYVSGSNIVFESRDDYSAVLHEIGHALGHGHNNNSGSCMVPSGGSKISAWDAEGGHEVMNFSNENAVSCQLPIYSADCIILIPYYLDSDGDGYGGNVVLMSESQPYGYVGISGDCDDSDPSINPSAVDIPCNGIDENCNGRDAKYKGCKGDGDDGGGKPDKPRGNPNR